MTEDAAMGGGTIEARELTRAFLPQAAFRTGARRVRGNQRKGSSGMPDEVSRARAAAVMGHRLGTGQATWTITW